MGNLKSESFLLLSSPYNLDFRLFRGKPKFLAQKFSIDKIDSVFITFPDWYFSSIGFMQRLPPLSKLKPAISLAILKVTGSSNLKNISIKIFFVSISDWLIGAITHRKQIISCDSNGLKHRLRIAFTQIVYALCSIIYVHGDFTHKLWVIIHFCLTNGSSSVKTRRYFRTTWNDHTSIRRVNRNKAPFNFWRPIFGRNFRILAKIFLFLVKC